MSVEKAFAEFSEIIAILQSSGEISLASSIEANARKGILLSAASEFEHLLCESVRKFANKASKSNARVMSLIETKAISRQYHTWFDWKGASANPFFALFGEEFSIEMKRRKKEEEEFSRAVTAFLELGQLRNLLVHNNYAAFYIEKSYTELFDTYTLARGFVANVDESLMSD